jgi:alpha-1,2-mannosyltransferase
MPLQNNFEHLNVNTILLALVLAAAADLADRRDARAGVWIGLATAIKAFPGLLLVWLALTRRWRALGAGVLVAGGLTYLTVLRYGPIDGIAMLWDWVTLSSTARSYAGAEVASLGMQKVARLVRALGGGAPAILLVHLALLGGAGVTLWRWRDRERALWGAGLTLLAAVLVAPIGWLHSFTLAFPAWVAALTWRPALAGAARRLWTTALVTAGVLTSSMLAHAPFSGALAFVPTHNDTAGSLLLALLMALGPFVVSDRQPELA